MVTQPCLKSPASTLTQGENRKLLAASKKGDKEKVLEVLNNENININFKDENGWNALHYACDEGNLKIVEILLKAGADINSKTNDKKTPLHLAAKHGYFDISKLLIENNAHVGALDNEKNLPLHLCALGNHTELLCYMLDHLPNVAIKNLYGKTPFDLITKEEARKAIKKYIKSNQPEQLHKIKIRTANAKQVNTLINQINSRGCKVTVKNIKYNPKFQSNDKSNKANKATAMKTVNSKSKVSNNNIMSISMSNQKTNTSANINSSLSSNGNCGPNTMHIKLPERLKVTVEPTSSKTPSVRKNYALKTINSKKYEITTPSTGNNIISTTINKMIKYPNKLSSSHSHSHSKSKKRQSVNKFAMNRNPSTSQRTNRSIKKNTLLNHKTISLPKFNHINVSNDMLRGRSANKSNFIDSTSKVANVEISLECSQKNNISDQEKITEGDNNNIIETLNSNEMKKTNDKEEDSGLEERRVNSSEKPNELVSLINVSGSSEEIMNSSNEISGNDDFEDSENQMDQGNKDSQSEHEKIGPSSFICLGLLGKGSFGEVYLVKQKKTSQLYAMKVLDKDRIMAQNIFKYAMTERNVLSLTSHPFIVKLNYAFQTTEKLFLLLDYCPGGDLAEQLSIQTRFSEAKAKFYLCEIILALGDLHQKDIIFRDLKPDNVVLDSEGHAMLTDFGLSREGVYDSRIAKSFCGSIAYLAPEMLSRTGHGKAVDWYLLGVLFYEMLVGIPPFFTNNKDQIFRNIEKGDLKIPGFVSEKASRLLKALLKRDPASRLGSVNDVEDIKSFEYFNDVDWDKVYRREMKPPKPQKNTNTVQMFKEPKLFADDEDTDENENGNTNNKYKDENENGGILNQKFEGWSFVQNNNFSNGK